MHVCRVVVFNALSAQAACMISPAGQSVHTADSKHRADKRADSKHGADKRAEKRVDTKHKRTADNWPAHTDHSANSTFCSLVNVCLPAVVLDLAYVGM